MSDQETFVCPFCQKTREMDDGTVGENIRPSLAEFIESKHPEWTPAQPICFEDLGKFRTEYVKRALQDELGELSTLDQEVIASLQQHELLSENIEHEFLRELTFGERLSDRIAEFGGSWRFLITFGFILLG